MTTEIYISKLILELESDIIIYRKDLESIKPNLYKYIDDYFNGIIFINSLTKYLKGCQLSIKTYKFDIARNNIKIEKLRNCKTIEDANKIMRSIISKEIVIEYINQNKKLKMEN